MGKQLSHTRRGEVCAGREILVKLTEGLPQIILDNLNRRNNALVEEKLPLNRLSVLRLPENLPIREAVRRYNAKPNFLLFPSGIFPNDPGFDKMYGQTWPRIAPRGAAARHGRNVRIQTFG